MDDFFCKKCGRVFWGNPAHEHKCDICNTIMIPVPEKYIKKTEILTDKQMYERVNEPNGLYEELVKPSPEFDPYLFEHRNEILAQKSAEFEAKMAHGKAILEGKNNTPKCPTCGSTNISKIGTLNRMFSVGMFGLASSKIGKTHKCNNCGSTW